MTRSTGSAAPLGTSRVPSSNSADPGSSFRMGESIGHTIAQRPTGSDLERPRSAEREHERLRASIEEFDVEQAVDDRPFLPHELVHPLLVEQPRSLVVHVVSRCATRWVPVDCYPEWDRRRTTHRTHHEMDVSRVESVRDATVRA